MVWYVFIPYKYLLAAGLEQYLTYPDCTSTGQVIVIDIPQTEGTDTQRDTPFTNVHSVLQPATEDRIQR